MMEGKGSAPVAKRPIERQKRLASGGERLTEIPKVEVFAPLKLQNKRRAALHRLRQAQNCFFRGRFINIDFDVTDCFY